MRKGRAFQAERTDFAKCRECEQHVWAVGGWSVEPQAHLGSRRVLKHEASAGALNPVAGVLIKRGHRHREEGCGKTDRDYSYAVTNQGTPRTDDSHQKPRGRCGTVPPSELQKE